ncbi:MAG: UDP-2,3-diacylglucosamine diphosphatase [Bacteroidales bacterium]|nr:UDP-2,3-diacylglucosamine diphosphatase [Bacteroidales bacterium]
MSRPLSYFVSDVHLGLDVSDPKGREARFVAFLRSIPAEETESLYLLGDIWDFWYEYRDVVPKGYVEVFAALSDLMKAGVKVWFFQGNHDIWSYHYFEELGMQRLEQPYYTEIGGVSFCLGHGDGLGPGNAGYKAMRWIFHCRPLQRLFSTLHPWIAFRIGTGWSRHSRLAKDIGYDFKGEEEALYKFCTAPGSPENTVFIFGHYHCSTDLCLPGGRRLILLRDWIGSSNWLSFDASTSQFTRTEV